MTWGRIYHRHEDGRCSIHVVPVDDLRPHVTEFDQECWCKPTVPESDFPHMQLHNALDQRDKCEHFQ